MIAKPTTWLSNAPTITKRLGELQRCRHVHSRKLVAAIITGLKDQLRTPLKTTDHQQSSLPVANQKKTRNCGVASRERSGWCGLFLKSMYGTRDAAANFPAIIMDPLTNMKFEVGKFVRACANTPARTLDTGLTVTCSDWPWFATELFIQLHLGPVQQLGITLGVFVIVIVRLACLRRGRQRCLCTDLAPIRSSCVNRTWSPKVGFTEQCLLCLACMSQYESYHAMLTKREWLAILGMGRRSEACGNHHGNARSETCEGTKTLSSPGIKRSMRKSCGSVCTRTIY